MSFIVLDTDVASRAFGGKLPPRFRAWLSGQSACISFVTLGELTEWTVWRQWGPRRLADLDAWLGNVVVLGYDEGVAKTWGHLHFADFAEHDGLRLVEIDGR